MVVQREPTFEPKRTSLRLAPAQTYDIELIAQAINITPAAVMSLALNLGLARILQLAEVESRFYPQLMEQTEAAITAVETQVRKVVLSREL